MLHLSDHLDCECSVVSSHRMRSVSLANVVVLQYPARHHPAIFDFVCYTRRPSFAQHSSFLHHI